MPQITPLKGIQKQLTTELEALQEFSRLRFPENTNLREAIKKHGKEIGEALRSSSTKILERALQTIEELWKLVPADIYCAYCRQAAETNNAEIKRLGAWRNNIPDDVLLNQIPADPRQTADGLGPALAAALGLIPKSKAHLAAAFEYSFTLEVLRRIQAETTPLRHLEQELLKRSSRGRIQFMKELALNDPELKKLADSFDPNCETCWLLVALHIKAQEAVNQEQFVEQIRKFRRLAADPEARRKAAVQEYFLMTCSYGREKLIGNGKVPVGYRDGCIVGACIDGHPFAIRYAPAERAYYIQTPFSSLGLEKQSWEEAGSGPVFGSRQHVRCASLSTLQKVLPKVLQTFAGRLITLGRPETVSDLITWLMISQIGRDDPKYLPEFIEKWAHYPYPRSVVIDACVAAGTFNPKEAFRRIQVQFSSLRSVPEHKQFELAEKSAKPEESPETSPAQQPKRLAFKSATRAIITTGRVYRVTGQPFGHSFWIGFEGLAHAVEVWGSKERMEELTPKGALARQTKKVTEILQSLAIAKPEGGKKMSAPRSRGILDGNLIQQRLLLLEELNAEIAERLSSVSRTIPSGLFSAAGHSYALRLQDAKGLPAWIRDNLERLPQHFQRNWERLMAGAIEAQSDEAREVLAQAFSLYDAEQLANRQAALGPIGIDLKWYSELPDSHPLKRKLGPSFGVDAETLLAPLRHITDAPGPIDQHQVETAYQKARIGELRRASAELLFGVPDNERTNPEYLRIWKGCVAFSAAEIQEAFQRLSSHFITADGKWHEVQESVPWERLKPTKDALVLTLKDFRNIKEAIAAFALNPDQEKARQAKPLAEMIEALQGLIKAYRVLRQFDTILEEEHAAGRLTEEDLKSELANEALKAAVERNEKRLLWGDKVFPVEHFEAETTPDPQDQNRRVYKRDFTLYEAVHRLRSRSRLKFPILNAAAAAEGIEKWGLYSEAQAYHRKLSLEKLIEEASRLRPTIDPAIQVELAAFKRVIEHPLTYNKALNQAGHPHADEWAAAEYLDNDELALIKQVNLNEVAFREAMVKLHLSENELRERIEKILGLQADFRFLEGGLTKGPALRLQPWVVNLNIEELAYQGKLLVVSGQGGLRHFNPDILPAALEHYEKNFVAIDAEWAQKAKKVMSPTSMVQLRRAGLGHASRQSLNAVAYLDPGRTRVHKELFAMVNQVYETIIGGTENFPYPRGAKPTLPFIGWNADGEPTLEFGNPPLRGQSLIHIACHHPQEIKKLSRLTLQRLDLSRYVHLRKIAQRILDRHIKPNPLSGPQQPPYIFENKQDFIEWLADGARD